MNIVMEFGGDISLHQFCKRNRQNL